MSKSSVMNFDVTTINYLGFEKARFLLYFSFT